MEDKAIVDLFFARSETAIEETQKKYGRYCHAIAKGILSSEEDAKECVSDAYVGAWNSIPPQNPENLATYLGKLTRNASLDRLRERKAKKRGENSPCVSLDELAECIPSEGGDIAEAMTLRDAVNSFLRSLPRETRIIFMQRYWYFRSVGDIAHERGITSAGVSMTLSRTRKKLREYLEKEGISI